MQKIALSQVVVVEGKYDKIRLQPLVDAIIVTTEGFAIYRDEEKKALIKKLAYQNGVVVLTDSDKAGFQIRNFLKNMLPEAEIIHVYIPDIFGKEKRKRISGKEGKLGVEGIDAEVLRKALQSAGLTGEGRFHQKGTLTKADLYAAGLSGGEMSTVKRKALANRLGLPENIGANALLEVLNALYDKKEAEELLRKS